MHGVFLMAVGMLMGGIMTASVTLGDQSSSTAAYSDQNIALELQDAARDIEDPELKAYYEQLLENMHPYLVPPPGAGAESHLPDIKGIYYESLTTPFQQAGQQIEDPELKAFYDRLIGEIGLDK